MSTTGRSNFQNRWRNFWEKLAINFSVENEGVREEGGADILVKKFRQSHLGHIGKSQVGHIGKK